MRILLANKYYYARGGADVHSIDLGELLREKGHEVAYFSMQHGLNQDSGYNEFFPAEVDYNDMKLKSLISKLVRPFGAAEVRKKYTKIIRAFNPDIVHLHNIHTQLSPVLATIAHRHRIPVVWTLHDHKLVCSRYDCMRNGKPCNLCFTQKINVIKYRCMKNSIGASIIGYIEALVWNKRILSRNTDVFLCPSNFLRRNMIAGGFEEKQLVYLPNFILDNKLIDVRTQRQEFYCFIGRLSKEKGIETLLMAAAELPQYELKVIGTGPMEDCLREKYKQKHIQFLGFKPWEEIKTILGNAKCMIFPSECLENNPLSIIESLCLGTPVIGARIGGITELIDNGINGFLYEPGNVKALQDRMKDLSLGEAAFEHYEIAGKARARFCSDAFYKTLFRIYSDLTVENI